MQTVLIVIHLLIVIALVGAILLQRSEGGGLGIGGGSGGGMGGFMTGRGAANVLTRTTAILAIGFFVTSIILTMLARGTGTPTSIIDNAAGTAAPTAPASQDAPASPAGDGQGVLKDLQKLQENTGPQVPQSQ
ncbi:MAG: preprotein translocase subunit SecG [Rhodobiaceae bacterium]|nr:preprotein translocase subunit SecG [Rhodobiaceae bacterium]